MSKMEATLPQARQDDIVIQELPDETLIYDLKRHQAFCLNRTAALVWQSCDGETTIAEMRARIEKKVGAAFDEDIVWLTLDRLAKAHLLNEKIDWPAQTPRLSRRKVMQKLGVGAVFAAPVILSVLAPEAAQAASCRGNAPGCLPNGLDCSAHSQCCSCRCNIGQPNPKCVS